MNNYMGIGRIANDPKTTAFNKQDGTQGFATHANFAVDYRQGNENKTAFINLTFFGQGATNLKKGDKLGIEAEIQDNTYTKDGTTHYGIVFVVKSWEYCIPKSNQNSQQTAPQAQTPAPQMQVAPQQAPQMQMQAASQMMPQQASPTPQMAPVPQQMAPQMAPPAPQQMAPAQMPMAPQQAPQMQAAPVPQVPIAPMGYENIPSELPFN